jgi:hypothetical protein
MTDLLDSADFITKCECPACREQVPATHGACPFCWEHCLLSRPMWTSNQRHFAEGLNILTHRQKFWLEEIGLDADDWIARIKTRGLESLTRYLDELDYNRSMFAARCGED